jgi:hypothetical protein
MLPGLVVDAEGMVKDSTLILGVSSYLGGSIIGKDGEGG